MPTRYGRLVGLAGYALLALAFQACEESTTPLGGPGPIEVGPRAGRYVVGEFGFSNACVQPPFALTGTRATNRSAVFDLRPSADDSGAVDLSGTFEVPDPTPGAPGIVIFAGPDTGQYRIVGDTLRLRFVRRPNDWVGIIGFTQYRGGVIAGGSGTRCSSMLLRLERQP